MPGIYQKMLYTVKFAGVLKPQKGLALHCLAESFFTRRLSPIVWLQAQSCFFLKGDMLALLIAVST